MFGTDFRHKPIATEQTAERTGVIFLEGILHRKIRRRRVSSDVDIVRRIECDARTDAEREVETRRFRSTKVGGKQNRGIRRVRVIPGDKRARSALEL